MGPGLDTVKATCHSSRVPPRRPRSAAPPPTEDLRDRILKASIQLVEQEGIAALSLREVARRAGVSHQAPYHHFPDRESVLAAIAEEGFRVLGDQLEEANASPPTSALRRLERSGAAYVTFACDHPAHFRIMFRPDLVNHASYPALEAQAERAYQCLRSIISETVRGSPMVGVSEDTLATLGWSCAHGLAQLLLEGSLQMAMESVSKRSCGTAVLPVALGAEPEGSEPIDRRVARDVFSAFRQLMEAFLVTSAGRLAPRVGKGKREK